MPKGKFFKASLLWLILILCLSLSLPVYADNGCPINIPTDPGNVKRNLCESSTIIWNVDSSITINRNSSRNIAITDTGKGGPYHWLVSGKGFSLAEPKTDTTNNTLRADGAACGTATVTVTGCNGQQVAGYVRCTTGTWIRIYCCYCTGGGNCYLGNVVIGKYRYFASWGATDLGRNCTTPLTKPSYPACLYVYGYPVKYVNNSMTEEWGCQ